MAVLFGKMLITDRVSNDRSRWNQPKVQMNYLLIIFFKYVWIVISKVIHKH